VSFTILSIKLQPVGDDYGLPLLERISANPIVARPRRGSRATFFDWRGETWANKLVVEFLCASFD
jgi:hypothetical protein